MKIMKMKSKIVKNVVFAIYIFFLFFAIVFSSSMLKVTLINDSLIHSRVNRVLPLAPVRQHKDFHHQQVKDKLSV